MDRYVLEGYGYAKIPDDPGMSDIEVRTWRPVGDITSQMRDHFLGTAVRLKEPTFVKGKDILGIYHNHYPLESPYPLNHTL